MEKELEFQIEQIYSKLSNLKSEDCSQVRIDLLRLIKRLLSKNSRLLKVLLYRIDVNEEKIIQLFNTIPSKYLAVKITDLIIGRELKKLRCCQLGKNKFCD